MSTKDAYEELNQRAAKRLVAAHREIEDEKVVLAIRYRLNEEDLYMFEVLESFPGEDDDEPFETEFDPSAELIILGKLHLTLASVAQLQNAIDHDLPVVSALKEGTVLYEEGGEEARHLKSQLCLR